MSAERFISSLFPFHIINDNELMHVVNGIDLCDFNESLFHIYEKSAGFDLKGFEYTEYSHNNYLKLVDPENNFYNISIDCSYYINIQMKDFNTNQSSTEIFQ